MCGFSVVSIPDKSSSHLAAAMISTLKHRGPDALSVRELPAISMAHARLAIVGGDNALQPMSTSDERYTLVFNGEIYNYQSLRTNLISDGVPFRTSSDTEVLLAGYAAHGTSFFSKLDGIFSAVIFDKEQQRVVCVRDRFGIKPLYYASLIGGGIAIASELSAFNPLRESALLTRTINQQSVHEYLSFGYVLEPSTWYLDTHALPPGTFISWDSSSPSYVSNSIQPQNYWSLTDTMLARKDAPGRDEGLSLLQTAISSQLPAEHETPYSIFLSGGLDSTIVATVARKINPLANVLAISTQFADAKDNETRAALKLAQELGIPFHRLFLDRASGLSADEVLSVFAEPFADNAAIATAKMSSIARSHGKVVLSGDGADEMFFGYRNHRLLNLETKLRPGENNDTCYRLLLQGLSAISSQSTKIPRVFRWKSTLESLLTPLSSSYIQAYGIASQLTVSRILHNHSGYSQVLAEKLTPPRILTELDDPMKLIQWMDLNCYLPSCILKKVDRTTMSSGVEARVPFLSSQLSERMLAAPSHGQLGFQNGKKTLRTWVDGVLPKERQRVKKTSFTSPLDLWFSMMTEMDFESSVAIPLQKSMWSEFINVEQVRKIYQQHVSKTQQHGPLLWALLLLSKFNP